MSELVLKYNLLDTTGQQEVQDFIDFLLSKQRRKVNPNFMESYKKQILEVSVWSEEDIAVFDENRKRLNQWTIQEW